MTLIDFIMLVVEWIGWESDNGFIDGGYQRARQFVENNLERARQWHRSSIRYSFIGIGLSIFIFLTGATIGWHFQINWPNAISGTLITIIIAIPLIMWTPLAAMVGVISEFKNTGLKKTPEAALRTGKTWLGIIVSILLWQLVVSLLFVVVPYWTQPARIPVVIFLGVFLAGISIQWATRRWYRPFINGVVVVLFFFNVLAFSFPQIANAIGGGIAKVDTKGAAILNGESTIVPGSKEKPWSKINYTETVTLGLKDRKETKMSFDPGDNIEIEVVKGNAVRRIMGGGLDELIAGKRRLTAKGSGILLFESKDVPAEIIVNKYNS